MEIERVQLVKDPHEMAALIEVSGWVVVKCLVLFPCSHVELFKTIFEFLDFSNKFVLLGKPAL